MSRYSYSPHQSQSPIEMLVTRPVYALLCAGALGGVLYLANAAGGRMDDAAGLARTGTGATESPRFALRPVEPVLLPAGEVWERLHGEDQAGGDVLQRGVLRVSRDPSFAFQSFVLTPTWAVWREEGGRFLDLAVGADGGGEYLFRIQGNEVAALYAMTPERRTLIERAPLKVQDGASLAIRRTGQRWSVLQGSNVILEVQLPGVTSHQVAVVTTVPRDGMQRATFEWILGEVPGSTAIGSSVTEAS